MGEWDDKFERAERKYASWRMRDYAQADRTIPHILEDKARTQPNRVVFQFPELEITYGDLNEQIHCIANGLLAAGVGRGDKVAMMLPNCPEFLIGWFGINKIGAANVPINVALRGDGLVHQIDHADCVMLIIDAAYLDHLALVADRLPKLRHVVVRGTAGRANWPGIESLTFSQLRDHPAVTPDIELSFKDLATISYTSGTTGVSKGVMMSHHYWFDIWVEATKYAHYTEDDILYTGLPFFHTSAHGTTGPSILTGARSVLVERFSASRMLADCRRWNCSSAKYIGSMLPILMKQAPDPRDADNPLRLMIGSATPRPIWHSFQERFNTRLLELYGMTECSSALVNPYDDRRPGSCGKPITGWNVKIADDEDNEVPAGQPGEFIAKPQREFLGTSGYYKMPEASRDLFRNGWIHTGDLGWMDEDGYFYYVDRKKQALRRRGENISSFEVEAVINIHPGVLESCVVGVPSELGEEEVKAVIVPRDGHRVTEEEIVQWCEPRMAYFAVPRFIAFRASLPKTPSERVEKYRLKQEGVTPDCWDREAAGIVIRR